MTSNLTSTVISRDLLDALIAVAVGAWLCARQLRWRAVDVDRMWTLPLVLGVLGALDLDRTPHHPPVTTTDVAVLAGSGLLALGSGAVMGALARFRPVAEEWAVGRRGRRGPSAQPPQSGDPPLTAPGCSSSSRRNRADSTAGLVDAVRATPPPARASAPGCDWRPRGACRGPQACDASSARNRRRSAPAR